MNIKIHNTTYIFLLISFLAGYFKHIFLFLFTIFIHESGHYFFSILSNIKIDKIIIYPFGGITQCKEQLNISIKKELVTLLGGIIFQLLFLVLIIFLYKNNLVLYEDYVLILKINKLLISFNFLPILPLDGGKLLNIFLDKMFSYKLSNKICIIISIFFSLVFFIKKKTIYSLILLLFLIKSIIIEILDLNTKYTKFLFERYCNNYKFKKIKIIKNINNLKRDNYHIINNTFEKEYLSKLFDRT